MTFWRTKDGREPKWSGTLPTEPWCVFEDRRRCKDGEDVGIVKPLKAKPEPKTNVVKLRGGKA